MNPSIGKYWKQYEWSNIAAMIKNMKSPPRRCGEMFRDRLVAITGATSGVGYHTARKYASMGASLVLINRNAEKAERVRKEIIDDFGTEVESVTADLSLVGDMQRAGRCLAELDRRIDVLIHNAGLHLTVRQETADGFEVNFALHHLAPFVVTSMLLPKLKREGGGRIIFVSSEAYRFAAWGLSLDDLQWTRRRYTGIKAYGAGKLAQILSMHSFARELAPYGATVNAFHPGMVKTETGKDNGRFYRWYKGKFIDPRSASPEISAEALYYLGVSSELAHASDIFFHLTTEEELSPPARDLEAADALCAKTRELLLQRGLTL